jgi:hypothetical protein
MGEYVTRGRCHGEMRWTTLSNEDTIPRHRVSSQLHIAGTYPTHARRFRSEDRTLASVDDSMASHDLASLAAIQLLSSCLACPAELTGPELSEPPLGYHPEPRHPT